VNDIRDNFVEHFHPEFGQGFFCTADVLDALASHTGEAEPVAWEVRNAEISYHAVFGTEREAKAIADQHDEEGYSQAVVRALYYATPPAAIPAAPSETLIDKLVEDFKTAARSHPTATNGYNLKIWDNLRSQLRAALTQPTTAQQAGQAYALKWCAAALQAVVAFHGERGSISMFVSGEKKSLEEVLDIADDALKTAQTTALPGDKEAA
jgi:hypothetical protein